MIKINRLSKLRSIEGCQRCNIAHHIAHQKFPSKYKNKTLIYLTTSAYHDCSDEATDETINLVENVQEWDVIRFVDDDSYRIGRVQTMNKDSSSMIIEILEEVDPGIWSPNGVEVTINIKSVVNTIVYDYSQRQVERSINPHGEEAEEIFMFSVYKDK